MIAADDELILKEVRGLVDTFASSLPDRIQRLALADKSEIPFMALAIRELLFHRVTALATAAAELFEQGRVIPAVVLTRAVVEVVAAFYTLHERVARFLRDRAADQLDAFLVRALLGARNNPSMPTSINILDFVDRVEKTIPGFRAVYDSLCEYTHSNWAGTLGAFGEVQRESLELKLGSSTRTAAFSIGVSALSGSLMTFQHYYDDSADLIMQLNSHFEHGVR